MRKSLLVLTSTFPRGVDDTTPPFVFELSRRLTEDFDVTVLTPAVPGAEDDQVLDGVRVRRFHYFWPRSLEIVADGAILDNVSRRPLLFMQVPLLVLFGCIAAYRLARAQRPSVIHAHWLIPQGLIAVLVGRLLKIPVVATAHGADVYRLDSALWRFIRRQVVLRCVAVTAVGRDMAARLSGGASGGQAAIVLSMGVDLDGFTSAPSDQPEGYPVLVFVGRLTEKKGVQYLIEAMPEVLKKHPGCRLIVVGDGPYRANLENAAMESGIADRVAFVGAKPRDRVAEYYQTCDVVVLPSLTEGFGLVLAEALACGRPVVATAVGGVPDIVADGRTGYLVQPAVPSQLASAIEKLLADPALRERMGALGRRFVRMKFSWSRVSRQYARVLLAADLAGHSKTSVVQDEKTHGAAFDRRT